MTNMRQIQDEGIYLHGDTAGTAEVGEVSDVGVWEVGLSVEGLSEVGLSEEGLSDVSTHWGPTQSLHNSPSQPDWHSHLPV